MGIRDPLKRLIEGEVSIAPLITFRMVFGALMFLSVVRFWWSGWIEKQFIEPSIHFKYFGFHWVPDLPDLGYYLVFLIMAISALGIAAGLFYKASAILFFLAFTFIELSDATYYLNHYYFVSLVAGILIFLPANRQHSLDVRFGMVSPTTKISAWQVNILKFQLGLVYFLAGVAKLNPDWLLDAMPLAIWLPAQDHLPIIGGLMPFNITAYVFSWSGALYDLCIPFLLLFRPTRLLAYAAVVIFHLLTWAMFQIGMFPFIMIASTLIFFSSEWHGRLHKALRFSTAGGAQLNFKSPRYVYPILASFVIFQLAMPFRYLLYPGELFWNEEGYRFGWRVMLVEKAGYAQFRVQDKQGREIYVDNADHLTAVQEKMMSTQPDFMLQYADYLKAYYASRGVEHASVKADVFVTLNGEPSRRFVDPNVDLAAEEDGWNHKSWIMPNEDKES